MRVDIPRFYVVKDEPAAVRSDTRASLVIHRFNIEAGATGVFDATLKRTGYDDYTEVHKLTFDIETTSLTPETGHCFMIGINIRCKGFNLYILHTTTRLKHNRIHVIKPFDVLFGIFS